MRGRYTAAAVALAALAAAPAAEAEPGGILHEGSCGLAAQFALPAVKDDTTLSGAQEWARVPPGSWGCTGND
jgi:hypothetical protein